MPGMGVHDSDPSNYGGMDVGGSLQLTGIKSKSIPDLVTRLCLKNSVVSTRGRDLNDTLWS